MRAPIGRRITARRKAVGLSQAELARRAGISASYLNLIEANKRHVGGALLLRIAAQLSLDIGDLTGDAEHRLIADVEEAFADSLLQRLSPGVGAAHELVAEHPEAAAAIARLHRGYLAATASAEDYSDRLRTDPLLSQLLYSILSGVTAIRSASEILEDTPDLDDLERSRFLAAITREARSLSDVARSLVGQFEADTNARRDVSPMRELDDLLFEHANYFPTLEELAVELRAEIDRAGPFGEVVLTDLLANQFGVTVRRDDGAGFAEPGFPGQYRFEADSRTMWFRNSTLAATRQFQLTRLYVELAAAKTIDGLVHTPTLSSTTSRRLAFRAFSAYLAGAIIFPYERFLAEAERQRYDIEALSQAFTASFEQVAHRLVTLRRPGAAGIPFGLLRSDPAGRLTKHFPLPGLLLPNAGHACPRWAIYSAFRAPGALVRQVARFASGSRYLFLARSGARRVASYSELAVPTSVMLACDVLHADGTVYASGLDLTDSTADTPVGPACRLCTRSDCSDRQEEQLLPERSGRSIRGTLVPREF